MKTQDTTKTQIAKTLRLAAAHLAVFNAQVRHAPAALVPVVRIPLRLREAHKHFLYPPRLPRRTRAGLSSQ